MQVKVNPIKRQGSGLLKLKSFRDIIFRPGKRKITIKLFLAISIIFLVYSSAMFTVGILAQRNLGFSNFIAKPIILDNFDILTRYINSIFAKPEVITIDISFKNYQKLEYTRKCALAKGTVYGIPNEWVNAKIRYKDQTIPARVRLKGATAAEHLDEKKWSFRIRIRGDKTLFGMKEFAVMSPMRRNLLGEWLIRRIHAKEGLIARKYELVKIIVNGEVKGIYVIDERYDNKMLERNHRREGPVIKIEQTPIFVEKLDFNPIARDDYYYSLDITAFKLNKILADETLKKEFTKAKSLMEGFRLGFFTTHEVFDLDRLAKWIAIGDVMGAWHGFAFSNMRFYYNPITSKFEPVPDDNYNERAYNFAAPSRLFRLNDTYNKGKFLKQLFSDHVFTERYLHELERVSKDSYLDSVFAEFHDDIRKNSYILAKDYPLYNFLLDSKAYTYKNAESLRNILNPYKGVQAYFQKKTESGIELKIANNKSIPMEILYLRNGNNEIFRPKTDDRIILDGRYDVTPVEYREYEFDYPSFETFNPQQISNFSLVYRVLGTSKKRTAEISPFPAFDRKILDNDIHRRKANFKKFNFLTLDPQKKEIKFKKGICTIEKDLIIPPNYTLIANAGTKIDLVNTSMILSYSPVVFVGLEGRPVSVISSDLTGQGITVINAKRKSLLKYVLFENLSCPKRNDWELTGAVNFYESPVYIYNTHFEKNVSGDDYLNLIRSEFAIEKLSTNNSAADTIDVDFCKGTIKDSTFAKCGVGNSNGDCVDFSGSIIEIGNISINGSGDKGISIGERSVVNIQQLRIKNAKIAIACKDSSVVNIDDLSIMDSQTGLAVFQKKSEFGPATIKIKELSMSNVGKPYLVEKGSSLSVNGKEVEPNSTGVKHILYGTTQ